MDFFLNLMKILPDGLTLEDLRKATPEKIWKADPVLGAMIGLAQAGFDTKDYLDRYPDVAQVGIDPIRHWVLHGWQEGRTFTLNRREPAPAQSGPALHGDTDADNLLGFTERLPIEEMLRLLAPYDVISFDIFDTALLRKVEFPKDIFTILGAEMGRGDFADIRQTAEADARRHKFKKYGHTEITIDEIYEVLAEQNGMDKSWMDREISLERLASEPNPYVLKLFRQLIDAGKEIVFCSDMYLPEKEIEAMLGRAGYAGYSRIYLSNSLSLHKGDGSLQKRMLDDFADKRIIHIGDNRATDYEQSLSAGLMALWLPDCRLRQREPDMDSLAGSFYRSTVNNELNTGPGNRDIYYKYGFRYGGVLAAGYCQHLNDIAKAENIDRILFCGRDCQIIQRVYESFYKRVDNVYIETSRMALLLLSPFSYADDILHRFIFRYWDESHGNLTLRQLLDDSGFSYLAPLLEEYDINQYQFCMHADKAQFRDFFLDNIGIIADHTRHSIEAAKLYYKKALGNASSLLVADVGWSGTCIEALARFIKEEINPSIKIRGALMCAGNSTRAAQATGSGQLYPYICGPGINADILAVMHPSGKTVQEIDKRHMALEYLFTAPYASLAGFSMGKNGEVVLLRESNEPDNKDQILEMQNGIFDFNRVYSDKIAKFAPGVRISPYTAISPLCQIFVNDAILNRIYGDFFYDACILGGKKSYARFSSLFAPVEEADFQIPPTGPSILMVTPELEHTGALNALLEAALVFRDIGLEPVIWSGKDGPFRSRLKEQNIAVRIVRPEEVGSGPNLETIGKCSLAWCNTVLTAEYAGILEPLLPTVWMIHEGKSVAWFCRHNPGWLDTLKQFENIYCVSDYAANGLRRHTSSTPKILPNYVPDHLEWHSGHIPGSGPVIKFCQFGTIEKLKGFDIALKAYQSLPDDYKRQCELHFAGRVIPSASAFCEWLFHEVEKEPGVHYHGMLTERRELAELLSEMDIVIVASRDESCSLVALEGAMMGKPLIVSENVGAKYMVTPSNGLVVETENPGSLAKAMMEMLDKRTMLAAQGSSSRQIYQARASRGEYEGNLRKLLARHCPEEFGENLTRVIVSLTSWPDRTGSIMPCINSLLDQTYQNCAIQLWLSEEEFPYREAELPAELVERQKEGKLEIFWVADNLKSHKKYFYAMQRNRDLPVITVDDDMIYERNMVKSLMDSYSRHPDCISCHRANLMSFRKNGEFRNYETWPIDYRELLDEPSMHLMPTGRGGVLYPPHAIPDSAFNPEAIKECCLEADDLWLKMNSALNGYPAVVATRHSEEREIEGTQSKALWRENLSGGKNNIYLQNICDWLVESNSAFADFRKDFPSAV